MVDIDTRPAGWYPSDAEQLERYWDGVGWTRDTRPLTRSAPAAPTRSGQPAAKQRRRGNPIRTGFGSLLALAGAGAMAFSAWLPWASGGFEGLIDATFEADAFDKDLPWFGTGADYPSDEFAFVKFLASGEFEWGTFAWGPVFVGLGAFVVLMLLVAAVRRNANIASVAALFVGVIGSLMGIASYVWFRREFDGFNRLYDLIGGEALGIVDFFEVEYGSLVALGGGVACVLGAVLLARPQ